MIMSTYGRNASGGIAPLILDFQNYMKLNGQLHTPIALPRWRSPLYPLITISVSPTQHMFLKSYSNSNSDTIKNIFIIYIHTVSPKSILINLPIPRIRITFLLHIQFPINWQTTSFRRITERRQHTQATRYLAPVISRINPSTGITR